MGGVGKYSTRVSLRPKGSCHMLGGPLTPSVSTGGAVGIGYRRICGEDSLVALKTRRGGSLSKCE